MQKKTYSKHAADHSPWLQAIQLIQRAAAAGVERAGSGSLDGRAGRDEVIRSKHD